MRFKVDENLPVEVAELLRGAGHDAATVADQGVGGALDPDLATLIRGESRALFSSLSCRRLSPCAGWHTLRLAVSGWTCPLTILAERLGAVRGSVTDIFLPRWFADRMFSICGTTYAVALLLVLFPVFS